MSDNVSHPSHYIHGGVETKDLMASMINGVEGLPNIAYFWWANAFKYLIRWPWKNGEEDLRKCAQCIDFMVEELQKNCELSIVLGPSYEGDGKMSDIENIAAEEFDRLGVHGSMLWLDALSKLWSWHRFEGFSGLLHAREQALDLADNYGCIFV